MHTVITAEDESKNGLKTHQVQEVPRKTGDPLHIKVASHDTRLQHRLEPDGKREGQFHCKICKLVAHIHLYQNATYR